MISISNVRTWLPADGPVVLPAVAVRPSRQRTGFAMSGAVLGGAPHATDVPADKTPYVSAPERCP
jgi:hypothetical protein